MLTFLCSNVGQTISHGPRRVCARWPLTVSLLVHDGSSMYVCTNPPPSHACRASDRGGNIETFRGICCAATGLMVSQSISIWQPTTSLELSLDWPLETITRRTIIKSNRDCHAARCQLY
ncbi:hypothetical protein BDW42DRAFT_23060 [Aspergillus taichungensis]|uniref:Uncharacterized protein n=1 Tax=Aspergillus taichungensis TaxID=482145 RepID=A0A2J5HH14_9EURO|nr:hypothetical protein BDW42DRAFT_23060 [Aspergillus taichungensis]